MTLETNLKVTQSSIVQNDEIKNPSTLSWTLLDNLQILKTSENVIEC